MFLKLLPIFLILMSAANFYSQAPPIEPGVSHDLAIWRAARYSDVRYKINLTLEKMSPVLKGTIEIQVKVASPANTATAFNPGAMGGTIARPEDRDVPPIILDWRKIRGHEDASTISNVSINGTSMRSAGLVSPSNRDGYFEDFSEHLIFRNGVVAGENVIKLDFTSAILTSGSAITRYIDKEDGSEYLYSLFVPSDASTAFPVFDQPDLKARFTLNVQYPRDWQVVSNTQSPSEIKPINGTAPSYADTTIYGKAFPETKPISTYLFAFAAGPFSNFREDYKDFLVTKDMVPIDPDERAKFYATFDIPKGQNPSFIYVRRSQAEKFKPHAAETFRLMHEDIKYLEGYFDYKFPWPKYDLVLIPEFPFGGMEHAGATFVREQSIIFPTEPTKSDYINRATLIFHETAHQWFGDTVTMKWFDDLWLKEGFANFMAYKAMEKIMPEMNAWKVFYERIKQPAYATDSTKGTTPIYQEIKNLSAAKSAYGNIVYNKAPAFLRQAEFYLGEDKFQTAVRTFLKKHEYANATWQDLVSEFGHASDNNLSKWAATWVRTPGLPTFRLRFDDYRRSIKATGLPGELKLVFSQSNNSVPPKSDSYTFGSPYEGPVWQEALQFYYVLDDGGTRTQKLTLEKADREIEEVWGYKFKGLDSKQAKKTMAPPKFVFTNYGDYGYGIFLLDDRSRDYVLKNVQNEKDPFLRSMMYGALWDSVREGELDPKEYVALVIRNLPTESDENIAASVLGRVTTAINYYLSDEAKVALTHPLEDLLEREMLNAKTSGRRITFYRSFLNIGASIQARDAYKKILAGKFWSKPATVGGLIVGENQEIPIKTKDKFDIVMRLASLGDPGAEKLLADLEKTETSDDAKRYAYAAHAAFATKDNREKFWNDFVSNKTISESWIEAAMGPFNSVRHDDLSLPYLQRALAELPNLKRDRKIFFVNGWLGAFIGGQKSQQALDIVNKFLADNPNLDNDLRLKILENVDVIERAVKIRAKYGK